MNTFKRFASQYFETILEIIEDKPNFLIPSFLYCGLILMYFLQICGYFFSNYEKKPLEDEKSSFLGRLFEVSPITFLLYMKGNDKLTLICFAGMQMLMLGYFLYVGFVAYLKIVGSLLLEQSAKLFQRINQFLNIFFTFYWWLFFTPYIEINSGIFVCGANSFLIEYRNVDDDKCSQKPFILQILSIMGLTLAFITGIIVIYNFRNYEFHEQNLLKRRYNSLLFLLLAFRFLLTFLYYLDIGIVVSFKHIAAHVIGVIQLYDYIMNFPFRDASVSKFYIVALSFYEISAIICSIWIFTDTLPSTQIFYILLMVGLAVGGSFLAYYQYRYEKIMKISPKTFSQYYRNLDFYCEEIISLLMQSEFNIQTRFSLLDVLHSHKEFCDNPTCISNNTHFMNSTRTQLDPLSIQILIEHIFNYNLMKQRLIVTNSLEFEHLSLKYISYLAKIRKNPLKSYCELKTLLCKSKSISIYFRTVSKVMSHNIEKQIKMDLVLLRSKIQNQISKGGQSGSGSNSNNYNVISSSVSGTEMNIDRLKQIENFKDEFVPKFLRFLDLKVEFWTQLSRAGFQTMKEFQHFTEKVTNMGKELKARFTSALEQLEEGKSGHTSAAGVGNGGSVNSNEKQTSIVMMKLQSIFQVIVQNDLASALKLEKLINDQRKRDSGKSLDIIHNGTILRGNLINIVVSLAKDRGKILSTATSKVAEFFKYSLQDFQSIVNINQVMPQFIGQMHDQLIQNAIQRGRSEFMIINKYTFCVNRTGFIMPINLYISNYFEYFDDYAMHGFLLKRIEDSADYILFNQFGKVLGITEHAFKLLFSESQITRLATQSTKKASMNKSKRFKMAQNNIGDNSVDKANDTENPNFILSNRSRKGHFVTLQQLQGICLIQFLMPKLLIMITQNKQSAISATAAAPITKTTAAETEAQGSNLLKEQYSFKSDQIILSNQKARFKIPLNIMEMNATYLRTQTGNFDRSIQSQQTIKASDLLNEKDCEQMLNFINQNKKYWRTKNCFNDFHATFDISIHNYKQVLIYYQFFQHLFIHNSYGLKQELSTLVFTMKIQELFIVDNLSESSLNMSQQTKNSGFTGLTDLEQDQLISPNQRKHKSNNNNILEKHDIHNIKSNNNLLLSDENRLVEQQNSKQALIIQQQLRENKRKKSVNQPKKQQQESLISIKNIPCQALSSTQNQNVSQSQQEVIMYSPKDGTSTNQQQPHQMQQHIYSNQNQSSSDYISNLQPQSVSTQYVQLQQASADSAIASQQQQQQQQNQIQQQNSQYLDDSNMDLLQQNNYNNMSSSNRYYNKPSTERPVLLNLKDNYQSHVNNESFVVTPSITQHSEIDIDNHPYQQQQLDQANKILSPSARQQQQNTHQKAQIEAQPLSSESDLQNQINQLQQNLQQPLQEQHLAQQQQQIFCAGQQNNQILNNNLAIVNDICQSGQNYLDEEAKEDALAEQIALQLQVEEEGLDEDDSDQRNIQSISLKDQEEHDNISKQDKSINQHSKKLRTIGPGSVQSQNSNASKLDNEILREIVNSQKMPSAVKKIDFLMVFFLIAFFIFAIVIILILTDYLEQFIQQLVQERQPSLFVTQINRILHCGLLTLYSQAGLIEVNKNYDFLAEAQKQFQVASTNIMNLIEQNNQILLEFNREDYNIDPELLHISIQIGSRGNSTYGITRVFVTVTQLLTLNFNQAQSLLNFFINTSTETNAMPNLSNWQATEGIRENIYFFIYNYLPNIKIMLQIINQNHGFIEQLQGSIMTIYLTFLFVIIAVFLIIFLFMGPLMLMINQYKEKLLLLVTRIYESESELEVDKYATIQNYLIDDRERWMTTDFIGIVLDNKVSRFKMKNKIGHHSAKLDIAKVGEGAGFREGNLVNTSQVNGNIHSNNQKGTRLNVAASKRKVLSSKIFEQKLPLFKTVLPSAIVCFITLLFFSGIIIYSAVAMANLKSSTQLGKELFSSNIALNSLITGSDIIALISKLNTFPDFNQVSDGHCNEILQFFNEQKKILNDFKNNFFAKIRDSQVFSSEDSGVYNQVNQLFTQNLCGELNHCPEQRKDDYKEGMSGVYQNYLSFFLSNDELYQCTQNQSQYNQTLREYVNSKDFEKLIAYAYQIPAESQKQLINVVIQANQDLIDSMQLVINLYVIILGSLLFVVLMILIIYNNRYLKNSIQSMNFLLTLIPHEKWQEDATIYMLKGLNRF